MTEHAIVLCTCPNSDSAEDVANTVVDARLAACVNIIKGVRSIFIWQGVRESSDEYLLVIKTRRDCYPKLEDAIKAVHPYELPEIVMVSMENGLAGYLTWIDETLKRI